MKMYKNNNNESFEFEVQVSRVVLPAYRICTLINNYKIFIPCSRRSTANKMCNHPSNSGWQITGNQSINQSIHQLIKQSIHPYIHQSNNQSIHQLINQSIHQSINPSIHQSINPSIYFA